MAIAAAPEIETEVRKIPQQTNEVNKIKTLVREGIQTLNDERARPNTTKNL